MIAAILAMIAVSGTVFTVVMPFFERDALKSRMKSVAIERDKLRARERARVAAESTQARTAIRAQPKQNLKNIVDRLNLQKAFSDEDTQAKLRMAGFRGTGPLYTFVLARLITPIVVFFIALFYVFAFLPDTYPSITKVCIALVLGGIGTFGPNIYLKNKITKRQADIRRAWPDTLDLMLICVESGMSIEAAFHRVAEEIGTQSIPLAEELSLTNAELSYLSDRRQAYENLGARTGVEGVKNVMMALIQAERYGTPVGQAIRVMADDNREARMQEAEKKAASLPPKLTVPMIVFFLPVLFVIIMTPAAFQIMDAF
ncbi:type II secretion system F family protein [Roseibium hamelinense]|nr:type II secretion system F family protein [Roseibium hamelinense]MTI43912.1 type II secretion system F family protein [Roseibium hamelinense]